MAPCVLGRKNRFFPREKPSGAGLTEEGAWDPSRSSECAPKRFLDSHSTLGWQSFQKNCNAILNLFFGGNIFKWLKHQKTEKNRQLPLEQQGFELHRPTYTRIFLDKFCSGSSLPYRFLSHIFFSLNFVARTQHTGRGKSRFTVVRVGSKAVVNAE